MRFSPRSNIFSFSGLFSCGVGMEGCPLQGIKCRCVIFDQAQIRRQFRYQKQVDSNQEAAVFSFFFESTITQICTGKATPLPPPPNSAWVPIASICLQFGHCFRAYNSLPAKYFRNRLGMTMHGVENPRTS